MNVLVIFTGGTIGCSKSGGVIDVDTKKTYQLLDSYTTQSNAKTVRFKAIQSIYTLSENLIPSDWENLLHTLNNVDQSQYDGIIIAHGTDTLPYTSAAISFGIQKCTVPVVFVSSDRPIDDVRSNGLANFTGAIDFIAQGVAAGVFVVFKNNNGETFVHLGSRLREADPYSDDFDSIDGVVFGKIEDGKFVYNNDKRNVRLRTLREYNFSERKSVLFDSNVLMIHPFVGLNYNYFKFNDNKPIAVLHSLYHSGTANTSDSEVHSIKSFAAYCHTQNVPIYAAPIKQSDDIYQSAKELMDAGVKPLVGYSLEVALVKLTMKCADNSVCLDKCIYFECL